MHRNNHYVAHAIGPSWDISCSGCQGIITYIRSALEPELDDTYKSGSTPSPPRGASLSTDRPFRPPKFRVTRHVKIPPRSNLESGTLLSGLVCSHTRSEGRVGGNIAQGQPMLCIKFPTGLDWLCYGCSACQPLQSGPGARGGVSTHTPSGQVPGAARRKSQSERRGMGDYSSEMAGRV